MAGNGSTEDIFMLAMEVSLPAAESFAAVESEVDELPELELQATNPTSSIAGSHLILLFIWLLFWNTIYTFNGLIAC